MSTSPTQEPGQGWEQPGWTPRLSPEPGAQGPPPNLQAPPEGWGPAGYGPYQPPPPRRRRKWPWILLAVIVLVIGGVVAIVASISHEINKTETVVYQVTGSASSVSVIYTTWDHGNISSNQQDVTLPWKQTETTSGLVKGGTLTITVGAGGGSATCTASVDGGTPSTSTANGAFSSAVCNVTG